jgi:hypothetical protein
VGSIYRHNEGGAPLAVAECALRFARLVCGNAGLVLRAVLEDLGIVADVTFFSVWPVWLDRKAFGPDCKVGFE